MKPILKHKGFTIVELLIVIVVIGILAAITIVAYNGVQSRAKTTQASSDMAALKKSMLAFKALYGELPPIGDSWNFDTIPPSCPSWSNVLSAMSTTGTGNNLALRDPWGNCYGYDDNDCNTNSAPLGQTYLKTVGPDQLNSTADDLTINISMGC